MSSPLLLVDQWASGGRSPWHRASALSKMAFVACVLFAVLTSVRWPFLLGVYAALLVLLRTARIPAGPAILLGLYPVMFSALFLLSRWDGTWQTPLVYLLRAFASCLAVVLLVGTTPYPDLFAPIARVVPRLLGDGLFLTYRAFFGLMQRAERTWTALRLRGGLTGTALRRDLTHAGEGLGQLVLHSHDRSLRLYQVMQLRGHSGRVCGCRHWAEFSVFDLVPLGLGALLVVLALLLGARP